MSRWNGVTVTLPAARSCVASPRPPNASPTSPRVLGDRGGPGGCWCMFWRLRNAEWRATSPPSARPTMAERFGDRRRPACWPISMIAPSAGARSRRGPSIPGCSRHRRSARSTTRRRGRCRACSSTAPRAVEGSASALVDAAVAMAKAYGAPAVDAIPVAPSGKRAAPATSTPARRRCSSRSGSPRLPAANRSDRSSD